MNIGDEVKDIPQDLEGLVKGDVSIGGKKIPKVAIAGLVVGLVVVLAIYTKKKSSGSSGGSTSGTGINGSGSGLGSISGDSFGGSSAGDLIGGIDASSPLSPLNNIPLPDIPIPVLTNNDTNPNYGEVPTLPYAPDMSGFSIPVMGSYGDYSDNTGINGANVPVQVNYSTGGVFKGKVTDSRLGKVTKKIPLNNPLNKTPMVLTKLAPKPVIQPIKYIVPAPIKQAVVNTVNPFVNVINLVGNLFNSPKIQPLPKVVVPVYAPMNYHPAPLPKPTPIFTTTKHVGSGGV